MAPGALQGLPSSLALQSGGDIACFLARVLFSSPLSLTQGMLTRRQQAETEANANPQPGPLESTFQAHGPFPLNPLRKGVPRAWRASASHLQKGSPRRDPVIDRRQIPSNPTAEPRAQLVGGILRRRSLSRPKMRQPALHRLGRERSKGCGAECISRSPKSANVRPHPGALYPKLS